MNADTASSLLSQHNNLRSWRQPFMFPTRDGLVDLSLAIGKKAATPANVSHYQPDNYPHWPKCRPVYRFDPTWYIGAADEVKLINDVKRSLVGVNYFLDNKYDTDQYRVVRLVCSFSNKLKKATTYKDECFMKVGTKMEPLKGRGLPTFDRLDNPKLKSRTNTKGRRSAAKRGGKPSLRRRANHRSTFRIPPFHICLGLSPVNLPAPRTNVKLFLAF